MMFLILFLLLWGPCTLLVYRVLTREGGPDGSEEG